MLDPQPILSTFDDIIENIFDSSNLDLLISFCKVKMTSTLRLMSSFISHTHMSPTYYLFVSTLSNMIIPKNVSKALARSRWHVAMEEEIISLE